MLAVKEARVGDFNGKSLSTLSSSIVEMDPEIPQGLHLRSWCAPKPWAQPFTSDVITVRIGCMGLRVSSRAQQ